MPWGRARFRAVSALFPPTIRRVTRPGPFVAVGREAAKLGLHLTEAQLADCATYAHALIEANETVNLTAITDPVDIAFKHFLDSFTAYAVRAWSGRERLVDVGSGAGFPGLALQIALPGISVTCVEATGKKARAIERFRDLLHLERAEVENSRAEDLVRTPAHRSRYDVATARALGSLAHCVELLFPFLHVGGDAIVWKGRVDAELASAERALAALGGEIAALVPTVALGLAEHLPGRSLVVMRKARPTPDAYPRTPAEMKRRPW
jgi:16S rRNA (guanine527-N7)-methyltransferase